MTKRSTPSVLIKALNRWLDTKGVRGDARVMTAKEWKERGEPYGNESVATLIIDGSPLFAALNYGEYGWETHEALVAFAEKHGYFWEQGFAWTVHFYPAD